MASGRVASIDILRCIAIIGMVLSANIGFFSDLPGWMFHAQTPPPTYDFNPDNPGITWVDLVFPFFLLSMGAALPFSLRRKLDRGVEMRRIWLGVVRRWLILTLFALALGNAYRIGLSGRPVWAQALFKIALWVGLGLFLADVRGLRKWVNKVLNLAGLLLLAACAPVLVFVFGVPLTTDSDIIMMILAAVSFSSAAFWLLTRDSLELRWLCIAAVVAVKAVSSYAPQALAFIPGVHPAVGWMFQWSFLQYLVPVLAGSVVGDMIMSFLKTPEHNGPIEEKIWIPAVTVALFAVVIQLWGLYTRNVVADLLVTVVSAVAFLAVTRRSAKSVWAGIGYIGFAMLLAGIVLDPLDGGIAKDYCNLSYLFTTSGMGILVVSVLLCAELNAGLRWRFLAEAGQNPMVAYTVTWFVIGPVLTLTGAMGLLDRLAAGSPFWGVMHGVVLTALMMLCTWGFTRAKIFWKS